MSCNDYIIWISGHIDGTNPKKDEKLLQAHLAGCPHCRKVLEDMKANEAVLKEEALTPPPVVAQNVMAAVRKAAAAKKKSRFRNYMVSIAAAAAVLCVVLSASLKVPEVPEATSGPRSADISPEAVMPVAEQPTAWAMDEQQATDVPPEADLVESTYATKTRSHEKNSPCHCVFVELPSQGDMPTDLPPMITEDLMARVTREAIDHYFYGGSIIYGATEMSCEEMLKWEDRIQCRFPQEFVETDTYIVVFCSESR